MGSAMASNLAKAGFRVHGYDIVPARRAALKKAGGVPETAIAKVARAAEVLITSLPSVAALRASTHDSRSRVHRLMSSALVESAQ